MSQSDLAAESASNGDENGEQDHLPTGMVCPSCGSKLVRRSMRRTLKDRFMSLIGKWPYRCQMCSLRFTGPQDAASLARENALDEEGHDEELPPEAPDKPK